jgi:3-isopropylmalate/(R)-2-methylmalate dehydratase small subunit
LNDVIENFNEKISSGDILVAGKNFGCGSSREHAPVAIKCCNISCVIAESFARIFYRNSINIGLPIISSEEASKKIEAGNQIQIDFENGKIKNLTKNEEYEGEVFPKFIMDIIKAGDLINYTKKRVNSGE